MDTQVSLRKSKHLSDNRADPRRIRAASFITTTIIAGFFSVMMAGCNPDETLFSSNFDQTVEGQPPSSVQAVGTAQIFGPVGSVTVVAPPVQPSGKWLRVSRPNGPEVAGFQGTFSQFRGDGVYTFSTTMFIPSGSGVATIQFETFTNPVTSLSAFLHLDFTADNHVRIDDNSSTAFGTFPRDQPFIVQVTLNINSSSSTAQIALSGAGASGQSNYTILSPFQLQSRQFGALRVWQGFPHTGAFNATNIVVTRDTE